MWSDRTSTPARLKVVAALLGVSWLAPFLGGSTEPWAWGVMSVIIGLCFLLLPPRHQLPAFVYLPAALLALWPLTAFLPASWFATPGWRLNLTRDLGLSLPGTITPQPWLTLESWLLLALGLSWLVYATSLLMVSRTRWNLARFYVTGAGLLAGLAILCALAKQPLPFWHAAQHFGFFPNRNQMGDWLALAALLIPALLYEDWGRHRLLTVWWLLVLGVIGAALVMNYSRAGVLIFFAGSTLFLLWISLMRRWTGRLMIGMAIAISMVTLFLLFGGETRDRLQRMAQPSDEPRYSRLEIQKDALALKHSSPWTGVGLGNFNAVFPFARDASRSEARILHPESDWVWLIAEVGWGALVVALIGYAIVMGLHFPVERGTARTLRLAAAIAVLGFAVHGLVDVSAHRLGSFLPVCLFALLLIHPRYLEPASNGLRLGFRWLGLVWCLVGAFFIWSWYSPRLLPASAGVIRAKQTADAALAKGDSVTAMVVLNQALGWSPLDWELYYRRATAQLVTYPTGARLDFLRARTLEPNSSLLPKQEGLLWLNLSPIATLTAWNEALRRDRHNVAELYSELLQQGGRVPLVREGLKNTALNRPDLFLIFVYGLTLEEFREMRLRLLARDPKLATFSAIQQQEFFRFWSEKEGLASFVETAQSMPTWKNAATPYLARRHAEQGDYAQAYTLLHATRPDPVYPQLNTGGSLEALQARALQRPDDFANAYVLTRTYLAASNYTAALETIRRVTPQKGCPAYFFHLQAEVAARLGLWEEAWKSLLQEEARAK
ncbi:MAG: hypothetical protein B9S32_03175 [Verrucomicrobia bacterium Tous-C9LFEB]|nr:MAG: hypothetical protein B9S32_03175 [Verrucomicrobia bacterium Tous-C9LFEB]